MPQQQQQQPNIWSTPSNPAAGTSNGNSQTAAAAQANIAAQIEEINSQQSRLKEQLLLSEKNLNAQHQVLLKLNT